MVPAGKEAADALRRSPLETLRRIVFFRSGKRCGKSSPPSAVNRHLRCGKSSRPQREALREIVPSAAIYF